MTLNGEEKYRQALYEEKRKADHAEIALLEQQLKHCQNTNRYLDDYVDKLLNQRDLVNGAIALYKTGERSEGITLDTIRGVME